MGSPLIPSLERASVVDSIVTVLLRRVVVVYGKIKWWNERRQQELRRRKARGEFELREGSQCSGLSCRSKNNRLPDTNHQFSSGTHFLLSGLGWSIPFRMSECLSSGAGPIFVVFRLKWVIDFNLLIVFFFLRWNCIEYKIDPKTSCPSPK